MQARKAPESAATRIQLSLRIRHPAIDPEEISSSLELKPEHCFKAGAPRRTGAAGRMTGQHTQTYWLAPISAESDPIEPTFEGLLLHFLHRLNASHAFLQRIQSDGGDVSVIMVIERESASDFTLPVSVARLLVQLGISIEFNFDS